MTLAAAFDAACFDAMCIAAPQQRWADLGAITSGPGWPPLQLVEGGERRQDSVYAALRHCLAHEHVCVHDAARPLVPPRLFRDVVAAAQASGAATAAVPVVDTIKRVRSERVVETLPRAELAATQTPQAFATSSLLRAHDEARARGVEADDDAQLVEQLGMTVTVVTGDRRNIKVTHAEDLALLATMLAGRA